MSTLDAWVASRTDGAPEVLRHRVETWASLAESGEDDAMTLAAAGLSALEAAVRQGRDRAVALDLLAADALVTLALLARAETDPAGLSAFARRLRTAGAARA